MTQLQKKKHDNGVNEVLTPKRNKHEVREAIKAKISSSSAKGVYSPTTHNDAIKFELLRAWEPANIM